MYVYKLQQVIVSSNSIIDKNTVYTRIFSRDQTKVNLAAARLCATIIFILAP